MKLKLYWILFATILLVAGTIRFYRLDDVPHGMTWDEAAIGYNGYAIWHTRRDEWLARLPISFQSFGDYKAPLAIYLNGLFTFLFGMNLWAVRLPFAIASIFAIAGFMLLVFELSRASGAKAARVLSLFGGAMMALSPWHIHYSRAGFESGLSLMLLLWGLWFWCYSLRVHSGRWRAYTTLKAVGCLVFSVYAYHSAKIVVPLLALVFMAFNFKKIWKHRKITIAAAVVGGVLLMPLMYDSLYGRGLQRLNSSILGDLSGWQLWQTIGKNLLVHLSPAFLVQGATTTLRHGGGGWGVLLPTTFVLGVFGLVLFVVELCRKQTMIKPDFRLFVISILWIIIGLLPAAIGKEVPHSNRALLALPGFLILALLGGKYLVQIIMNTAYNRRVKGTHHEDDQVYKAVLGSIILVHLLFAIGFLHYYFTSFARNSADAFSDGYLEAFAAVKPYEEQVDKILFTSDYGQPYIYALFARKTNPIWYRGGSLVKYEFEETINIGDLERPNTIVVASNTDDIPVDRASQVIYGSDGSVRFKIYLPERLKQHLK